MCPSELFKVLGESLLQEMPLYTVKDGFCVFFTHQTLVLHFRARRTRQRFAFDTTQHVEL